jgi:hypothetical protein
MARSFPPPALTIAVMVLLVPSVAVFAQVSRPEDSEPAQMALEWVEAEDEQLTELLNGNQVRPTLNTVQ